jgi:hypothetical protein
MTHLVLVAGHAIPRDLQRLDSDEGWHLKHFQAGEGALYVEHARAGVLAAADDPAALLIFAGGQTDSAAGPRSEGQGYWLIAEAHSWFGCPDVQNRSTTEEFSMDSLENLLFGCCRFREFTGGYPKRITVVGWRFKAERFELHRAAIGFPAARYSYLGPNDPPNLNEALHFEALRREHYLLDPYGAAEEPARKRLDRNFSRRQHGYHRSCPELNALLDWRGPDLFPGPLPWGTAS